MINSNLERVYKYLPKGYARIVACRLGVSASLVYKVKLQKRKNIDITKVLTKLALDNKKQFDLVEEQIQEEGFEEK